MLTLLPPHQRSPHRSVRTRLVLTAVAVAASALVLSGCSSPSTPAASSDCKPSGKAVKLTFWTWGNGWKDATALWNKTHPKIQVSYNEIPSGGSGGYQKMLNAVKAGSAPDDALIEFDTLPEFRSQNAVVDIASCLAAAKLPATAIAPAVLSQAQLGDPKTVWNVPGVGGPMALYYRADLFKKFGISVPTTWDEYAADAIKVHDADPSVYLGNFSTTDAPWFAALAAQAGAKWFQNSNGKWSVNLTDDSTKKVTTLWSGLLNKGAVSTLSDFTPAWGAALAKGSLLSWPSAVWGAGIVQSNAPSLSGDWAVAQLPNWGSGAPVSSLWGGGGLSVLKGSKHPYEAAEFAYWMATNKDAIAIQAKTGTFPTVPSLLSLPVYSQPNAYFGNQVIYKQFSTATTNLPNITWGPDMSATYSAIQDAFGTEVNAKPVDLGSVLGSTQSTIVTGLKQGGIPVK
jgi:multiple sugar transport system substrate-binding protein